MALQIIDTKESPLLSRKEISASLSFPDKPTPSNDDVLKQVASALKIDPEQVVIKHIYTHFGEQEANVIAFAYDSKEARDAIEPKKKGKEEKKEGEAAPAKEAPAEKPAAEPAEEKKVEAPAEEKKETPAGEKKE